MSLWKALIVSSETRSQRGAYPSLRSTLRVWLLGRTDEKGDAEEVVVEKGRKWLLRMGEL